MWKQFGTVVILGQALLGCSSTLDASDSQRRGAGQIGSASLGQDHLDVQSETDCRPFNSYMASLATLTANCLGTVDPRSYEIDSDGFLVPTFSACVDGEPGKLSSIRQLLSLQYRSALLPSAKACMAGRYATARANFEESGTSVCPTWEFVRTENPITKEVIAAVVRQLPTLPSNDPLPPGILDGERPALETINLYSVSFNEAPKTGSSPASITALENSSDSGDASPSCHGAADCAKLCASPFPGFVVGMSKTPDGREGLLTDPDSWLDSTVFANASADPYLHPVFYHPMSYYGGAPGVQFGHPYRALPCGLNADGTPTCKSEMCSYYAGIHKRTRLQLDCNDYSNWNTCVSYCGPPLPAHPPVVLP